MRAFVLRDAAPIREHSLELTEVPEPEPGRGDLRLRVLACGICRTDLHVVEGDLPPARRPVIPGHQVVGVVDRVGEGVEGWEPGDRANEELQRLAEEGFDGIGVLVTGEA